MRSDVLIEAEIRVLEMVAGKREWENGAAVNVCLEFLRDTGFITEYLGVHPELTEAGRAALKAREDGA